MLQNMFFGILIKAVKEKIGKKTFSLQNTSEMSFHQVTYSTCQAFWSQEIFDLKVKNQLK